MKKYIHLVCACALVIISAAKSSAQTQYYKDSVQAYVLDTTALPQAPVNGIIVSNNATANQIFSTYNVHTAIQRYPTASAAYLRQVYLYVCSCDETQLKTEMQSHPDIFTSVQLVQIPEVLAVNNISVGRESIQVYPNPVSTQLHIKSVVEIDAIRITDMSGRIVFSQTKPASEIDLQRLPAGNYLLNMECNGSTTSRIFSKQ
ncbi:T9SS type A sorting domain-containing protein [Chitinophagaceae bacterium MMS25-I14]